jgi:hypothetical protein
MRKRLLFCVAFAAAAILFASDIAKSSDRRDRDRDTIGYNILAERMFKGWVATKPHTIDHFVYFSLRTANSEIEVQLGPEEFMARANFALNTGDMVTVIGMPAVINGREFVLAREVRTMNAVLILRDRMGLPVWEKDRPIQMDPERHSAFRNC